MDKKALVEFVRTAILHSEAVADNQKVAHFKRVEQAVVYAFDQLLANIPMSDDGKTQIEEYYVKHYYNQVVSESNGYRYVGVSDSIAPVGDGKGIWYVQPSGGGKAFSRFKRPSTALFRSLPIGDAMVETTWRLGNISTNPQIILEDIGESPTTDIRKVDFGVVRSLGSYSDSEEVRVPNGRMDLLMQMALTWFGKRFNDLANDNQ